MPSAGSPGSQDLRSLGVDFGDARIGVAICDSSGTLATPLETIRRSGSMEHDHRQLFELAQSTGATRVVVGVPYRLQGGVGPAAEAVLAEITALRTALGDSIPVHIQDERFSTVTAAEAMKNMGVKAKRRREIVDQIAAAVILQSWLDRTKTGSVPPLTD